MTNNLFYEIVKLKVVTETVINNFGLIFKKSKIIKTVIKKISRGENSNRIVIKTFSINQYLIKTTFHFSLNIVGPKR